MREEAIIKSMQDEVRAIKTAYNEAASNIVLYTYVLDVPVIQIGDYEYILKTITFRTNNRSNVIASIEGATYERLPYEGGAQFYLIRKLGQEVKLHSMQEGEIEIS